MLFALSMTLYTKATQAFTFNSEELSDSETIETIEPDHKIEYVKVDREEKLRKFLSKYKSPLEPNVEAFITAADEYNLDYRILPAIACLESGCGKHLIPDSYNPFGWGVYGKNYIAFKSYDEAILKVGEGLHKGYVLKGADSIEKIAPIYNPGNHAKWLQNVKFFMNQIEKS